MIRQARLSHYVDEALVIYPQGKRLTAEDSRTIVSLAFEKMSG